MTTVTIELPDELIFDIQNILKQQDIKQFAQEAIKSKFLQEKEAQQKERMALIKANEIARVNEAKKGHTPITQKFIGLLAGSHLDESDYKKHLEEKYL